MGGPERHRVVPGRSDALGRMIANVSFTWAHPNEKDSQAVVEAANSARLMHDTRL